MNFKNLRHGAVILSLFLIITGCKKEFTVTENDFDTQEIADFLETDFPFVSTYLDARDLGESFPTDNVVARGLVLNLGDSAYVCFDTDLLRWSVAWTGHHLPMVLLPQVSNREPFNRNNDIPRINGQAVIANGMYPGWTTDSVFHGETRPESQNRAGFFWGAIPAEQGRWDGVYTIQDRALLSYTVGKARIREFPEAIQSSAGYVFVRTLEIQGADQLLYLNAAEVNIGEFAEIPGDIACIKQGDTLTAVGAFDSDGKAYPVHIKENRFISVEIPAGEGKRQVSVYHWKGHHSDLENFQRVAKEHRVQIPVPGKGAARRWKEKVIAKGRLSTDTAAFVTDILTLPVPNPWNRNFRAADIAFLSKEKAAVVTFSGDVWLVDGITHDLDKLIWSRYASGLFEPMSIQVYNGDIYVYGKEGIVRLHDLNGDGEADFYENFSNVMQQSTETREWATDMVIAPEGGFYIAKGGAVAGGPGITPSSGPGFRSGSNQTGTVVKISADGRKAEVIATGFRVPYIGIHPETGALTASDQQGNFVPATPIYVVKKGEYYGVEPNRHAPEPLQVSRPLNWIPYHADRSGSSQVWVTGGKMGPLNHSLIHLSFGRPGAFRVLIDSTSQGLQGGVSYIQADYIAPTIKGTVGPEDGQLYLAGLNMFGSNSRGISAIQRLRYTGQPSYLPTGFKAGKQGVILEFGVPIGQVSADHFQVKRWNYQRTSRYGSGHFSMDGTSGEEGLPVIASFLSSDSKKVLLVIPQMSVVDQMEIQYKITSGDGREIEDEFWLTVNHLDELETSGFADIDFKELFAREQRSGRTVTLIPVSAERGKQIFTRAGCIGCHSEEQRTEGMYGPPLGGIYNTDRELQNGSTVKANDAYLRESMIYPERKVVKGYNSEMPSFLGILSESDLESVILYIKSLAKGE